MSTMSEEVIDLYDFTNLEVGDRVKVPVTFGVEPGAQGLHRAEGTVIYIHPERRYLVIEFQFAERYGPIREAYHIGRQLLPQDTRDRVSERHGTHFNRTKEAWNEAAGKTKKMHHGCYLEYI